jgi:5'-nucleotidase
MRILISNDDGVFAPGLTILAEELATIAHVDVMAPDRNRSGSSNALTLSNPLRVKQLENGYYTVDGTPTDCVHLALTGFFDPIPDIVISGMNDGANLGDDILYSGTVAAAMEGRNLGLPAMAVSMMGTDIQYYHIGATVIKNLLTRLRSHQFPTQTVLNINIPDRPFAEIQGIEVTRLGTRHMAQSMVKETDPRGRTLFWVGPPGLEADAGPGTDFYAVNRGYVSITPLQLDMTHYKGFAQVSDWIANMAEETV